MRTFAKLFSMNAKAADPLAKEVELLHQSPLVDPVWYRQTYPDLRDTAIDVARHYLEHGAAEGRNPHPLFDTKYYLTENPDVAAVGMNPLVHYILRGAAEGRKPYRISDVRGNPSELGRSGDPKQAPESARNKHVNQYEETLSVALGARDPRYAPIATTPICVQPDDPSILAFYLPQFHPIPENDLWWGKGFTEWTNVSKAVSQFSGHYQPRLPGELGFYDLRLPQVMARQIELARLYGVSGFCFHYYWFNGHRLLEAPIDGFLSNKGKGFNFPFCLCWANENWTRRWDGSEEDILMMQSHTDEDHKNVFDDLSRYMSDERYVRVNGKPMVVLYRPSIIPNVKHMVDTWRSRAESLGYPGLYLVATTAFGLSRHEDIGFDAICQFPPHAVEVQCQNEKLERLNQSFTGNVYDYGKTVDAYLKLLQAVSDEGRGSDFFPGVMTGWDNEARRPGRGHVFHGSTPEKFNRWLREAVEWSHANNGEGRRFVFVNAWNEWAEGTYLEPDRKFGYGYLSAVANVHAERSSNLESLSLLAYSVTRKKKKNSNVVLCVHCYYRDLIDELSAAIAAAQSVAPMDVIISIPSNWPTEAARAVVASLDPVRIVICENRGRDVWPFLQTLRLASELNYEIGCKIHTKKSLHLPSGARWRQGLIRGLLGHHGVSSALSAFTADRTVGLVAPTEAMYSINNAAAMRDNRANVDMIISAAGLEGCPLRNFVAGTMFWFRLSAMTKVIRLPFGREEFGPELGAIDGTLAHAFERLFPTLVVGSGYKVANYTTGDSFVPY